MKIIKKPAASKLVARFDNELKTILMNDLKVLKAGAKILFLKQAQPEQLSVA
jgi:hypothetical protein